VKIWEEFEGIMSNFKMKSPGFENSFQKNSQMKIGSTATSTFVIGTFMDTETVLMKKEERVLLKDKTHIL